MQAEDKQRSRLNKKDQMLNHMVEMFALKKIHAGCGQQNRRVGSRMVTPRSTTPVIKLCNSTQRSSHEMKGTQHSNSTNRIPGTHLL